MDKNIENKNIKIILYVFIFVFNIIFLIKIIKLN
jgi:hypothetical protein